MGETKKHKHERTESQPPWWKRWWACTAAGVSFVAAIITILLFALGLLPRHSTGIRFTDPLPSEVSEKRCVFSVSGRGTSPEGKILVLGNQVQGTGDNVDPLLHLVVATMKPGADHWSADMVIGNTTTKSGTSYTVTAWLMDANWISYLTGQVYPIRNWWASYKLPPDAKVVATAIVTRVGGAMPGCPPPPPKSK
jgi:hypothetical protein